MNEKQTAGDGPRPEVIINGVRYVPAERIERTLSVLGRITDELRYASDYLQRTQEAAAQPDQLSRAAREEAAKAQYAEAYGEHVMKACEQMKQAHGDRPPQPAARRWIFEEVDASEQAYSISLGGHNLRLVERPE